MLKASALYMVIVIALVIGVICSSLIAVAYFYRQQYQQAIRYDTLQNNVSSGVNILIVDKSNEYTDGRKISLFGGDADSVYLKTTPWGLYDIGVSQAFIGSDTITKPFSMAYAVDSAKWAALYMPDEDRPVSVSGKTTVRGNAFVPKSGVRQAYIEGNAYQGDKRLIIGKTFNSQKSLPAVNAARLAQLEKQFDDIVSDDPRQMVPDSLSRSFVLKPTVISLGKKITTIGHVVLKGNIILKSDTTITIGEDAKLEHILVFAPYILVKKGFKGTCQLFATDSVKQEGGSVLNYPSAIGVVRYRPSNIGQPASINISDGAVFSGCVFAYDKNAVRDKQPIIRVGKKSEISGQLYAPGLVEINDGAKVNGSVFTTRFLYRSGFTVFENYIINTTIDATALSRYYLSSDLLPVISPKRKVLQWLN